MKTLSSLLLDSSLTASSCDNDSSDMQADQNPNEPEVLANRLQLKTDTTFGQIITDSEGNSLHFSSKDTKKASEYNGNPITFESDYTPDKVLTFNMTSITRRTPYVFTNFTSKKIIIPTIYSK